MYHVNVKALMYKYDVNNHLDNFPTGIIVEWLLSNMISTFKTDNLCIGVLIN